MKAIESTSDSLLASKLHQLIELADHSMRTMDPSCVKRLRASTENFIVQNYGIKSIFQAHFRAVDSWPSIYNIQEIKGILEAIKDDFNIRPMPGLSFPDSRPPIDSSPHIDKLTGILLKEFYINGTYNWEAIQNLININSDYFEYRVQDASAIYHKFKERKIIAFTGIGDVYCITAEGKKLYERQFAPYSKQSTSGLNEIEHTFLEDVFICHASKDKPLLQGILSEFTRRGISYWLDEDKVQPGDLVIDKLSEGLKHCRYILVCISRHQLTSGWCAAEYQSIQTNILSKRSLQTILPLILDDTRDKDIPEFLKPIHRTRLNNHEEYQKLLSFLTKKADAS